MEIAMSMEQLPNVATEGPDGADRALLDRYRRQGDLEALERLLERHAAVAYRVALRFAGNPADADDVLQDAFISCMASAKGFRGTGSVKSWIIAIVANSWRRRIRALGRRRQHEGRAMEINPPPADQGPSDEIRERALACLGELPESYRVPVTMRYLDGLDFPDIAAALDTKEKSVRTRVSRGLERLRSALGQRGVAVGAPALGMAMAGTATPAVPSHLPALVQATLAKGAALPAAQLAATAVGGIWLTTPMMISLIVVLLAAGGIGVWQASQPAPFAVSTAAVDPPAEDGVVARALAQPISISCEERLDEVVIHLRRALPSGLRVPITFVGYQGSPELVIGDPRPVRLTVEVRDRPLREALDALCAMGGLRWRSSSAGIVIDRVSAAGERERLVRAFAQAERDAIVPAAKALAGCRDADGLRPLLLAAAGGGARAVAAAEALESSGLDALIAFSDDREICTAVRQAVECNRAPRDILLRVAGRLRLGAVVEGCIVLARAGIAPKTTLEELLRGKGEVMRFRLAAAAIDALGWIGDPRAVEPLLESAAAKGDQTVFVAIEALGRIGDPRAIDPLLAIASDRKARFFHREAAGLALGEIGDARVVAPLGTIMLDQGLDFHVRRAATRALGTLGGPQAADLLRQEAARVGDKDLGICGNAIAELGCFPGPETEAVLLDALDTQLAATVCQALGKLRDPALIPRLKERLRTATGTDAFLHATDALAAIRLPAARQALLDSLPADGSPLLGCMVDALAACGSPETTRALIALAERPSGVSGIAAQRLVQCGPEGIAAAIRLAEEGRDGEVRKQAISGFSPWEQRGDILPRATLNRWLGHADAGIRLAATLLLWSGRLDEPFTTAAFLTASRDPAVEIRKVAVELIFAWNRGGDPRVLERCTAMVVEDPSPVVRALAAGQVFEFGFPSAGRLTREEIASAADHLVKAATEDVDPCVRACAGVTLMKMARDLEGSRPMPADLSVQRRALEEHLRHEPDARVRRVVAKVQDPANADWLNTRPDWLPLPAAPAPPAVQPPVPAPEF